MWQGSQSSEKDNTLEVELTDCLVTCITHSFPQLSNLHKSAPSHKPEGVSLELSHHIWSSCNTITLLCTTITSQYPVTCYIILQHYYTLQHHHTTASCLVLSWRRTIRLTQAHKLQDATHSLYQPVTHYHKPADTLSQSQYSWSVRSDHISYNTAIQ